MAESDRCVSPTVGYVIQSLVDAARGAPSDGAVQQAVHDWHLQDGRTWANGKHRPPAAIPCSSAVAFREGRVDPACVAHLFPGTRKPNTPPRTCEVILAPEVHVAHAIGAGRSQRVAQTLVPLLVAAEVNEQGMLSPRRGALPWVPRRFVEPHGTTGPTIGTLDDLQSAIQLMNPDSIATWKDVERACIHLYTAVTGSGPKTMKIPGYERVDDLAILVAEGDRLNISRAIRSVLEALPADGSLPPLLHTYLHGDAPPSAPLDLIAQQPLAAMHLGQMGSAHALSPNQRQTLHHVLAMCAGGAGEILAVNGPPGTGKTTLLQSVVASLWVQGALAQGVPPVIAATSTNNQAVTNILDSFGTASAGGTGSVLERRWLDGLYSHGIFHAGSKRDPGGYQYISGNSTNLPTEALDDVQRSRMESKFLGWARECFGRPVPHVQAATEAVYAELHQVGTAIASAAEAMRSFRSVHALVAPEHRASEVRARLLSRLADRELELQELSCQRDAFGALVRSRPWWLRWLTKLLWTVWPQAFENVRAANRASAPHLIDRGGPHTDRAALAAFTATQQDLCAARDKARSDLDESQRVERVLRGVLNLTPDLTLDDLLAATESQLDRGLRYRAFWLATHYWEGRWLLEMAKPPEAAAPREVRLAMLAPCHVATCYSLPAARKRLVSGPEGKIDLLLVDEAGQVSPEVGAAAFALARNALVVGDTYQLEPVWGIEPALDHANLLRYGLDCEHMQQRGLSAATGSVMRVATQACRYRQFPAPHPSGLFLTEHRRCRDPIIAYCNELTYGGVLEPLRGAGGAKLDLPAMAFVPFVGETKSSGGSRSNKLEAEAIAAWISEHLPAIALAYGARDETAVLGLIGVVTPFRAQSATISRALAARGLPPFTVGTVHALQGAEREIVIFSPTYSAADRPSRPFFDAGPNMLNVAVSRAKDHFIVFGDPGIIREGAARTPSSLLARHLETMANSKSGSDLAAHVQSLQPW